MLRMALVLCIVSICSIADAQVFQRVMVCNGNTCQMQIVPRVVRQPSTTYSVVPSTTTYSSPVVSSTTIRSSCNCGVTGVCTCPNCNCEHKTSSSVASVTALHSDFRTSLMQAARQARKDGEISALQFFTIAAASRSPAMLEKIQSAVHEAAIEEGLASTTAIDWTKLIALIQELIPIIIQLIDLFK